MGSVNKVTIVFFFPPLACRCVFRILFWAFSLILQLNISFCFHSLFFVLIVMPFFACDKVSNELF